MHESVIDSRLRLVPHPDFGYPGELTLAPTQQKNSTRTQCRELDVVGPVTAPSVLELTKSLW